MTIREQAAVIVAALEQWAEAHKGTAHVAGDVVAAIELLRARPGAPKAVVIFQSDVPREPEDAGRVDRQWKVVVARGRGFRTDTGESLTAGVAGGEPMFDLVEAAREIVRGVRLDELTTEGELVFKGTRPFEVQGIVLDAYESTFEIGTQLPDGLATENTENTEGN
jgi:hypothetical protein